jgi:hypothetical protein
LKGDREKYHLDMKLVCDGRSFFFTRKGYFGLGPLIAKEGDVVVLLFGGRALYMLRKVDNYGGEKYSEQKGGEQKGRRKVIAVGDEDVVEGEKERYKLVGEAFVQGFMKGDGLTIGEDRKFVIC